MKEETGREHHPNFKTIEFQYHDTSKKKAIIYGAGGSLGGAVAKAFAEAGARVFLTGRSLPSIQKAAEEILSAGGKAEVDIVDALDKNAFRIILKKFYKKRAP